MKTEEKTDRIMGVFAIVTILIAWVVGANLSQKDIYPKLSNAFPQANKYVDLGYDWSNCTVVSFHLEKLEQGSSAKLVHSGFKYLPSEIHEEIHQRYVDYWNNSGRLERFQTLMMAEDNQS